MLFPVSWPVSFGLRHARGHGLRTSCLALRKGRRAVKHASALSVRLGELRGEDQSEAVFGAPARTINVSTINAFSISIGIGGLCTPFGGVSKRPWAAGCPDVRAAAPAPQALPPWRSMNFAKASSCCLMKLRVVFKRPDLSSNFDAQLPMKISGLFRVKASGTPSSGANHRYVALAVW